MAKDLTVGGSMQTRLKEQIDADLAENYASVTYFMNSRNKYEINCGECNRILYADKETAERITRSIKRGIDNPFLCNDCEQEFDEFACEIR